MKTIKTTTLFIIIIGINTGKSPGDLRTLAVTQTPLEDNQLILKRNNNNNNNNNNNKKKKKKKKKKKQKKKKKKIYLWFQMFDRSTEIPVIFSHFLKLNLKAIEAALFTGIWRKGNNSRFKDFHLLWLVPWNIPRNEGPSVVNSGML